MEYEFSMEHPENHLKTAEIGTEQNLNMVDGILNNTAPEPPHVNQEWDDSLNSRPSIRAQLKENVAHCERPSSVKEHKKEVDKHQAL